MDLGSLRDLALELNLAAHGVEVLVTLEGAAGIETRGIWMTPISEDLPVAGEFQRREPRRVMALSRLELPSVPKGTVIQAPPKHGDNLEYWRVDGTERTEADHVRVYVIPIPADEV
jgi:hypothetical protein